MHRVRHPAPRAHRKPHLRRDRSEKRSQIGDSILKSGKIRRRCRSMWRRRAGSRPLPRPPRRGGTRNSYSNSCRPAVPTRGKHFFQQKAIRSDRFIRVSGQTHTNVTPAMPCRISAGRTGRAKPRSSGAATRPRPIQRETRAAARRCSTSTKPSSAAARRAADGTPAQAEAWWLRPGQAIQIPAALSNKRIGKRHFFVTGCSDRLANFSTFWSKPRPLS